MALFGLFSVIDGSCEFWMGSFPKNIQLKLEFLKALFLVWHFLLYINALPHFVCNIIINADDTTLYFKCD